MPRAKVAARRTARALAACGLLASACTSETGVTLLTPELSVQPAEVDFGEVVAGEEGVFELHVSNVGQADLLGDIVAQEGPFGFLGEAHLELEVDETVVVPVTFTPPDLGPFDSSLAISSNDQDQPLYTVPLHGTGRVPYAPEIEVLPPALDFGTVDQGATSERIFQIWNRGDADLLLGSLGLEGAGAFSLVADPSFSSIGPGQSIALAIDYTAPNVNGDSGVLHIESNDADEGVVDVALTANGGGEQDYPVAVYDCPGTIDMIGGSTELTLDGSASYDPGYGTIVAYAWTIVSRPDSADPDRAIVPDDQPVGTLLIDAAGDWEVSLVVTNDFSMPSPPTKCVISVVPVDELHVELSWSGETSDMDLHLAIDDAPFYDVPGDVSWCNPTAAWGAAGPDDDGHLDLDDDDGLGPEQAGVTSPQDGHDYTIRVHLFDDGADLSTTATVAVWSLGEQVWTGSQVLDRNEVWEVGTVTWPGTFSLGGDVWDAGGTRECDSN